MSQHFKHPTTERASVCLQSVPLPPAPPPYLACVLVAQHYPAHTHHPSIACGVHIASIAHATVSDSISTLPQNFELEEQLLLEKVSCFVSVQQMHLLASIVIVLSLSRCCFQR